MSPAETAEFMAEHLRIRYGESVKTRFVDLAHGLPIDSKDREVAQRIIDEDLPVPLVAINGVPKMSGFVAYRMITDAIDAVREVEDG